MKKNLPYKIPEEGEILEELFSLKKMTKSKKMINKINKIIRMARSPVGRMKIVWWPKKE